MASSFLALKFPFHHIFLVPVRSTGQEFFRRRLMRKARHVVSLVAV
jgi:hypothetical protein